MKKRILPVVLLCILSITALMVSCEDIPVIDAITVAKSGADYDTIQAAIDIAEDGDVIVISAGTYEGVLVDRPVTLRAAERGVVIDGIVHIQAKKVRVEGLAVIPDVGLEISEYSKSRRIAVFLDTDSEATFDGIHIDGGDASVIQYSRGIMARPGSTFTVRNSTFENVFTSIFVNLGTGDRARVTLSADSNSFTNNWAGIGGTEYSDVTITNNVFKSIGLSVNQGKGEGIGLGKGVAIFDSEGNEITDTENSEGMKPDVAALLEKNSFRYSKENKVKDYRVGM